MCVCQSSLRYSLSLSPSVGLSQFLPLTCDSLSLSLRSFSLSVYIYIYVYVHVHISYEWAGREEPGRSESSLDARTCSSFVKLSTVSSFCLLDKHGKHEG